MYKNGSKRTVLYSNSTREYERRCTVQYSMYNTVSSNAIPQRVMNTENKMVPGLSNTQAIFAYLHASLHAEQSTVLYCTSVCMYSTLYSTLLYEYCIRRWRGSGGRKTRAGAHLKNQGWHLSQIGHITNVLLLLHTSCLRAATALAFQWFIIPHQSSRPSPYGHLLHQHALNQQEAARARVPRRVHLQRDACPDEHHETRDRRRQQPRGV